MSYGLAQIGITTLRWGTYGGVAGIVGGLIIAPWAGLGAGILGTAISNASHGHSTKNLEDGSRCGLSTMIVTPIITGVGMFVVSAAVGGIWATCSHMYF